MKGGLYPEDIAVVYASRKLGRPVKWTPTRLDEFLSSTHGRDIESHAELALDAQGKVLGLRVRTLANMGSYASTTGIIIQLMIGPWVQTSIYDIRVIDFDLRAVLTHTAPTSAYRGAGRPEAIYIIERLFDIAAPKLGLDPAENPPPQRDRPGPHALQERHGPSLRLRQVRLDPRPRPEAGEMGRLPGPRGRVKSPRHAARSRHGVLPRMDRRQRLRGTRHRRRLRRWHHRGLRRNNADGAGDRHLLRPARHGRVRRRDRAYPHRHGRHRPGRGLWQRRLPLSVHRRISHQPRL